MAEITIYCDAEYCRNNEDGFCWADKLHLDSNGVCMTESNDAYMTKDELDIICALLTKWEKEEAIENV